MRLLLTNDDGIEAEGLRALEVAVRDLGELWVVAPVEPMSNCGHRVTTERPLVARQVGPQRFSVDGSPADCVRLGLLHLVPEVDWVLSGINHGGNLGIDVYMSGTVAAVREATLWDKPAIAFSQYRRAGGGFRWDRAERMAADVFRQLRQSELGSGEFWNVNFPDRDGDGEPPQLVLCHPDSSRLDVRFERRGDGFVYRGAYRDRPRSQGTDVDRCFAGHIAVSKLSCRVPSSS